MTHSRSHINLETLIFGQLRYTSVLNSVFPDSFEEDVFVADEDDDEVDDDEVLDDDESDEIDEEEEFGEYPPGKWM